MQRRWHGLRCEHANDRTCLFSEDQEVRNLLQVTVLEYLRSWYLLQSRSEKLMLPETKKIFAHVKSYLQEPEQDALPYLST